MHDLEEQERIDALKDWWKLHGNAVTLAVAVFTAAVVGVQGWKYYQKTRLHEAAALYSVLQEVTGAGDIKKIREAAGQLIDKYPATPYAARSALLAARANFEAGDVKSAKAQLQWTTEHASQGELKDLARLRLAIVLLDEKDFAAALKQLEATHGKAFDSQYADLKGDVLHAQGKPAEARTAYRAALDKLQQGSAYRQLIQMKLDALGA